MERLVECCVEDFSAVKEITNDWVESVRDNNYTEFENLSAVLKPSFFDNDEIVQRDLFRKLRSLLIEYEQAHDNSEIWTELNNSDVPAKKLIILMWYAVELALPKSSSQMAVQTGVTAATSYIVLCSIKGSSAYNTFNQFFYERCFELFRQIQRAYTFGTRESVQLKPKNKQKGKKKVQEVFDETEIGEEEHLDKDIAGNLLDEILRAFFIMFTKIALGGYRQPAILTVSLLRDICNIDKDNKGIKVAIVKCLQEFDSLRNKTEKVFALFHQLADDKHSNGGELIHSRIVFPRLSFWGMDNGPAGTSIPASIIQWKEVIIRFIEERIRLNIESELKIILRILQNLYCRCIDKSEYRLKVSGSVVEVLNLLPRNYKFEFLRDVVTFAQNARTSIRNFSVECIPAIIRNIDFGEEDPGTNEDNGVTIKEDNMKLDKTIKQEQSDEEMKDTDTDDEDEDKQRKNKKSSQENKAPAVGKLKIDPMVALNQCLIRFCLDKTSNIRGRAVIHLSQLLQTPFHKDVIQKVANDMLESDTWLYIPRKQSKRGETEDDDNNVEEEVNDELEESLLEEIDNLIVYIIKRAAEDRTASVRKAGVIALGSYLPSVAVTQEFNDLLDIIKDRCVDCSLMVRKQAAEILSYLLKAETLYNEEIEMAWLEFVLPMMNDREQSVQQLSSKLIYENLIHPLVGDTSMLTWNLLNKVEQQDNHRRLLVRTLFYLSQENVITEKIVKSIYNKLKDFPKRDNVLWMILAELAVVFKISPELALSNWYQFSEDERSNKVRYVAKVLVASTPQMNSKETTELINDIKHKLLNYLVAPPHISTVYLLLAKLLNAIGESALGKQTLEAFAITILKKCQKQVKTYIDQFGDELHLENGESVEKIENCLIAVISTIGEVIQFSPSLMNKCEHIVEALKTIMASDEILGDSVIRLRVQNSNIPSLNHTLFSRPQTALQSERQSRAQSRGPFQTQMTDARDSQGIQPTLATQPSLGTQASLPSSIQTNIIPPNIHVASIFTPVVRAYCVLVLGKFCLMDYKRAKECVPVFVNQLRVNNDHIVRNNIIMVICDLCIRNTQLVDRYSPIIAGCLKDQSTLVRHQTLESLTNLIKEQFIRWEGQIMYRFVSTILDEDPNIRKYAEFCLENVLLKQFPDMFYRHFIECLLYFNDVPNNHLIGESKDAEIDSKFKFTLSGNRNKANRMKLYKFMLKTFDDKDKFTTMANICEKALMPAVLGEVEFKDKRVQSLLRDSFEVMSCKEIKLSMDVGKGNEEDEDEPPAAVLAEAKKMITAAYRKGIIQTIMPHLLDVRAFLMEKRSPLLKNCLIVLRNICIEHQEQIAEVLGGDKQLQAEIEYDIKKFEEQIAHEQRIAKTVERDRRRSMKSLAAAEIIMSAVKNTARRQNPQRELGNIIPIPMEIEEDALEQNATIVAPPKENKQEQILSATRLSNKTLVEQNQEAEKTLSNRVENIESMAKENTTWKSRLRTPKKENTLSKEQLEQIADKTYTKEKILTSQENNKEDAGNFTVPDSPFVTMRKRTRESSLQLDSTEVVAPRAFSTPNKTIGELTFTNLELSAIKNDETQTRKRTGSHRLSKRRGTNGLDPIEEDGSVTID